MWGAVCCQFGRSGIKLRKWFFVLPLLFLTTPLFAMWTQYSDAELFDSSEVIIKARLIGAAEVKLSAEQGSMVLGVLQVDQVLKGEQGTRVILLALPPRGGPVSSSDLIYREGQEGLWFLYQRLRGDKGIKGVYLADHPQRFVPAKDVDERLKTMRKLLDR